MKNLFIGIWHGDQPHVQPHSTGSDLSEDYAAYALARHAERTVVPDVILWIKSTAHGPKVHAEWTKDHDYLQDDFEVLAARVASERES